MDGNNLFGYYINELPKVSYLHKRGTDIYNILSMSIRNEIENMYKSKNNYLNLNPIGQIKFPYYKMGSVDVLNLFDLDEIIIFSFYWLNRNRYRNVADLGANLGLHSIIMDKCGFIVQSYEPDKWHFEILSKNILNNKCTNIKPYNVAVSDFNGETNFTRVLGNTTGSHISGSKQNPYGELETVKVQVVEFEKIINSVDFLKMDVEGHEVVLIQSVSVEAWESVDALMEITDSKNAKLVFEYFYNNNIKMFSQKINWEQVQSIEDIPVSYKEGTLFVSKYNKPFS